MGLIGPNLVLTMIMASFLSKLAPIYSFARWILSRGLIYYTMPSDQELKKLAGVPPSSGAGGARNRKKRQEQQKDDASSFTVPKSLDFPLTSMPVTAMTLIQLHFWRDLRWVIDVSVASCVVYGLTEIYVAFTHPPHGTNLSLFWCALAAAFALRALCALTALYFKTEAAGERSMCFAFGTFFFVLAMGLLLLDDQTLELGLNSAYANFTNTTRTFLRAQNVTQHAAPASDVGFKLSLAALAALLGTCLTFPGLRYARMHHLSVQYASGSPVLQLLLYTDFLAPFFAILSWVTPLFRNPLTQPRAGPVRLSDADVDTLQVALLISVCLLRLALTKIRLQAHLNLTIEQTAASRREAGRVSVKDLRRVIQAPLLYLNVATLQYVSPILLLLFSTLVVKTCGDVSWTGSHRVQGVVYNVTSSEPSAPLPQYLQGVEELVSQYGASVEALRGVVSASLVRAFAAFVCCWVKICLGITSVFGLVHHAYFT